MRTACSSSSSVRRDSGVDTNQIKKSTSEPPAPHEQVAAVDLANLTDNNINYNNISLKRALCDSSLGWTERPEIAAKRRNNSKGNNTNEPRVLCPLYKGNPDAHKDRVSCFNKGFAAMSRLKQHLVNEHKVDKSRFDFFKSQSFLRLGTLDAKWRHVYCVLFPGVSEDAIPSPGRCPSAV